MIPELVWIAVLSAIGALVLLGAGVLAWMYSGEYNVAASKPHPALAAWSLETVMENSVQDRAAEIPVPPLDDSSIVRGWVSPLPGDVHDLLRGTGRGTVGDG